MNRYPIKPRRKKELQKKLTDLKKELQKIHEDIKYYRSFCNFTEDTPFDETLDEQFKVTEEIRTIENILAHTIVSTTHETLTKVTIGSEVTFKELPNGDKKTYTLVSPIEVDPMHCKISIQSPIGKALLDHKLEDIVTIAIPNGEIEVQIIEIC